MNARKGLFMFIPFEAVVSGRGGVGSFVTVPFTRVLKRDVLLIETKGGKGNV